MADYIDKAIQMLEGTRNELAYLTKYGSHLYGTSTPTSDTDLKGLFWPNMKDLVLQKRCNAITYSSGDSSGKNTKDDVDIQFWSVQYWAELLRVGDTNAMDLLFSMYSEESRLVGFDKVKEILGEFVDTPAKLLDVKTNRAYIDYCYNQARKYGLKGSKIDSIKKAIDFFKTLLAKHSDEKDDLRISNYLDEIIELCAGKDHKNLCFKREILSGNKIQQCLMFCGKGYLENLRVTEAIERLENEYKKFGHRAVLAAENEGIDFKAISHAVRACRQLNELIDTGFIHYPLSCRQELIDIKQGKKDWSTELEPLLEKLLDETEEKLNTLEKNHDLAKNLEKLVLKHYGLEKE